MRCLSKILVTASVTCLSSTSCAHTPKRVPAGAVPVSPCETAITGGGDLDSLRKMYTRQEEDWRGRLEFFTKYYPLKIHGIMHLPSEKSSCDAEREVSRYSTDLDHQIEFVKTAIASFEGVASPQYKLKQPLFEEKFPDTLACYSECLARNANQTKSGPKQCATQCAADKAFMDYFLSDPSTQQVAEACLANSLPGTITQKRLVLIAAWRRTMPEMKKFLQETVATNEERTRALRKTLSQLIALKDEYSKFTFSRQQLKCPDEIPSWVGSARPAIVLMRHEKFFGTGFYVRTISGRVLLTAAHVPDLSQEVPLRKQYLGDDILKNDHYEQFELMPGRIDQDRDVAYTPVKSNGVNLELVGDNELPKIGQKIFVAGFPGAQKKLFIYQCRMEGFGPSFHGRKNASYRLDCPGRPDIRGASGGPAFGEDGRVWGVNSSQTDYGSTVFVAPVSLSRDGNIRFGIQQQFVSDFCYSERASLPEPCQIMPDQYETDIP